MEESGARYDVRLGDVSESQVVIGDHTNVFTPDGVRVVKIVSADGRPEPHLRHVPVIDRPRPPAVLVGREAELAACAEVSSDSPLQLHGPEGAGKTTLLKRVANTASTPPDGVVFLRARRRSLDDVESMLFDEFWESDARFVPGPGELPRYLGGRRALVVIDDLDLDRDDLDALLDAGPECTLVVGSPERTLWDRGRSVPVAGLDDDAGAELIARALGRSLTPDELDAARGASDALDGMPQSLVEAAAVVRDGLASLAEIARSPGEVAARVPDEALTDSQRRILRALAVVPGTSLGPSAVAQVAGVSDAESELEGLERLGLVRGDSPRYRVDVPTARLVEALGRADLIRRLAAWVDAQREPRDVAAESEAIEAALELGADRRLDDDVLALARAAEAKLGLAGLLGSWRRVLSAGLGAARARGREADEAYLLHQLGSRAIAVGAAADAAEQLGEALAIRERIGDARGAELTRANLDQLGGHGRGPRPAPRVLWVAAMVVLVVAAGAGLAIALSGGDTSRNPTTDTATPTTTPTTTSDEPARVRIVEPRDGGLYRSPPTPVYDCTPVSVKCDYSVEPQATVAGPHTLTVTARGTSTSDSVRYTLDPSPPTISISITSGEPSVVHYRCADRLSGMASCTAIDNGDGQPVSDGGALYASDSSVRVTATDQAGNTVSETYPEAGSP